LRACKRTLCMIQPAKPSGKRAARTVRNLCCVLPDARSVQPGPGHHGHVDKLVAEVLERHIIVLWLVGNNNGHLVTTIPVSVSVPVRFLHDRPAVLRRGRRRSRRGWGRNRERVRVGGVWRRRARGARRADVRVGQGEGRAGAVSRFTRDGNGCGSRHRARRPRVRRLVVRTTPDGLRVRGRLGVGCAVPGIIFAPLCDRIRKV